MDEIDQWLERAYQAGGDREKLDRLYDEWAKDYDQHIWSSGNPYITVATGLAGRHITDRQAHILDAGCGTGNMAQALSYLGFTNIDGLDPSPGMLELARRKGVYRSVHQLALGTRVDLPDGSYDAVVAAGVLTHGHAPAESLDGIVGLLRPAGLIIFSLSKQALRLGYDDKITELERRQAWELVDQSLWFRTYPFSEKEAHVQHAVFVYRKR